jgi:hypothetical protein
MTNNNAKDPLESLVKSTEDINFRIREQLTEILKPYIVIHKDSDELVFTQEIGQVQRKMQIALWLCGQLAKALLKNREEETAGVTQSAIIANLKKQLNIPAGTVKSSLNRLKKDQLIGYQDGHYFVNTYHITGIKERLNRSRL